LSDLKSSIICLVEDLEPRRMRRQNWVEDGVVFGRGQEERRCRCRRWRVMFG